MHNGCKEHELYPELARLLKTLRKGMIGYDEDDV